MNIGILDCKVGGQYIEEIDRYRERGFDVINAGALDRPKKAYDILASTWTQLSAKRLKNVGCRAVVVKDNDEPFNVIRQETIDEIKKLRGELPVQLIENWGISTRVEWNIAQIARYAPTLESLMIIADTPSHDEIAKSFSDKVYVEYTGVTPNGLLETFNHTCYDVVIVHLSKDDFTQHWFDGLLRLRIAKQLLISTTRGALMSAKALNIAVANHTPETAVLDWAWQQDQITPRLIAEKRIVLTGHTSYRSAQSKRELTNVTIAAVDKVAATLADGATGPA